MECALEIPRFTMRSPKSLAGPPFLNTSLCRIQIGCVWWLCSSLTH